MLRLLFFVGFFLYLTLDLSLAAMPGAFVFNAAESVETTHGRRSSAANAILLPTPAQRPFEVARVRLDGAASPPLPSDRLPLFHDTLVRLPRASLDLTAVASEDPH